MLLQEIANIYGISRQRVHQICRMYKVTPEYQQLWPIEGFVLRMKRWLWQCGYRRCTCGIWSDKVTKATRRCPDCNAAYVRAWAHTDRGRLLRSEQNKRYSARRQNED